MSDQDLEIQRIIVTGTPIDGFTYIGPFDSFESAESYADHIGVMGDWWITSLQPPVQSDSLPLHYPGAAIPIPPAWEATHVSKADGSEARLVSATEGVFENENGDQWEDRVNDWEPILTQDQPVPDTTTDLAERINWLHCNVQELEARGVELPMGDYGDVYAIIEDAREALS